MKGDFIICNIILFFLIQATIVSEGVLKILISYNRLNYESLAICNVLLELNKQVVKCYQHCTMFPYPSCAHTFATSKMPLDDSKHKF